MRSAKNSTMLLKKFTIRSTNTNFKILFKNMRIIFNQLKAKSDKKLQ